MTPEGLRPIRCQSCAKLICEADGTVVFRCARCKRRNHDVQLPRREGGAGLAVGGDRAQAAASRRVEHVTGAVAVSDALRDELHG